jgi:hypothetical protein
LGLFLFRRLQRQTRGFHPFRGFLDRRLRRRQILGRDGAVLQFLGLTVQVFQLAIQPFMAFGRQPDLAVQGAAPGLGGGDDLGKAGDLRFQLVRQPIGLGKPGGGLGLAFLFALARRLDRRAFLGQPLCRLAGFLGKCGLAFDIVADLPETRLGLRARGDDALLLAVEFGPRQGQPLQRRRSFRLRLAQIRHFGGEIRLTRRFPGGIPGRLADRRLGIAQSRRDLQPLLHRQAPAAVQQHRLGPADLFAHGAVARRLAGLLTQAVELGAERLDHILQPLEIGLGGLQAQFRFVPAGVQAADIGGFLQNHPAFRGLGADDRPDPALADDARRPGAGAGIGEQQLHVAAAHLLAVDPVIGAFRALDPPRDVELRRVVERRRRRAVGVIHQQ